MSINCKNDKIMAFTAGSKLTSLVLDNFSSSNGFLVFLLSFSVKPKISGRPKKSYTEPSPGDVYRMHSGEGDISWMAHLQLKSAIQTFHLLEASQFGQKKFSDVFLCSFGILPFICRP